MNLGMRITTNAMIRNYSTGLNKALGDLDSDRNTVASGRNFNKISENPASAMKSFKLRSNFARTDVQIENTKDSQEKFDAVTLNVLNCSSMTKTFLTTRLRAVNAPTSSFETRQAYKNEVDQLIDSFLQQMNGTYNENFIFGGASTKDLPFEKVDGEILYRGLPVNTQTYLTRDEVSDILSGIEAGQQAVDSNGNPVVDDANQPVLVKPEDGGLGLTGTALTDALKAIMGEEKTISYDKLAAALENEDVIKKLGTGATDADKLISGQSNVYKLKLNSGIDNQLKYNTYMNEHSYRDIGFGMKEENGKIVSTSAFDAAVNGLQVFGHGVDEDGLPNNIVALAQELSNLLGKEEIVGEDLEKFGKIIDKFPQAHSDMVDNGLAALGTKAAFLENTHDLLTETSQILNEQISNLDFCDPAEAITNLMWSQYTYNATLKVGNTLLSNSFIDFMS